MESEEENVNWISKMEEKLLPQPSQIAKEDRDGEDSQEDNVGMDLGPAMDDSGDEGNTNFVSNSSQFPFSSQQKIFEGVELIAEPQRVQNIHINYSKTAKRIDVKSLKKSLWDQIKDPNNFASLKTVNKSDKKKSLSGEKEVSFQHVLETLPSRLPPSEKSSISVPLAFICLLHLANENGLVLNQNNLDELYVGNIKN